MYCHAETEKIVLNLEKTEREQNSIPQIQKVYLIFLKLIVHHKSGLKVTRKDLGYSLGKNPSNLINKDNETLEPIAELERQARKTEQESHRYHLLVLEGLVLKREESVSEIHLLCFTWGVWNSIFKVIQYHSITSWLRLE